MLLVATEVQRAACSSMMAQDLSAGSRMTFTSADPKFISVVSHFFPEIFGRFLCRYFP